MENLTVSFSKQMVTTILTQLCRIVAVEKAIRNF